MKTDNERSVYVYAGIACVFIILFTNCGTVASVQPLGRGRKALALSSGGPVKELFGIKMPIPYSVLRYRYGLNDRIDLHAGVHVTALALGDLNLDAGVTRQVIVQRGMRPSISVELGIYAFNRPGEVTATRFFPALSVIASNAFTSARHIAYCGAQSMFQFTRPMAVVSPLVGIEIPLGARMLLDLEARWYAPNEDSENRVVDYEIKPFSQGAVGFVWGLSFKF